MVPLNPSLRGTMLAHLIAIGEWSEERDAAMDAVLQGLTTLDPDPGGQVAPGLGHQVREIAAPARRSRRPVAHTRLEVNNRSIYPGNDFRDSLSRQTVPKRRDSSCRGVGEKPLGG